MGGDIRGFLRGDPPYRPNAANLNTEGFKRSRLAAKFISDPGAMKLRTIPEHENATFHFTQNEISTLTLISPHGQGSISVYLDGSGYDAGESSCRR